MTHHFEYHLHTGSGWTKAILSLSDNDSAATYFDSRWMGAGINRYQITWSHEKRSPVYGLLKLRTVERYLGFDSDERVYEDLEMWIKDYAEEEESTPKLSEIVFEYILLPHNEIFIAEEPTLEEMRAMGYAWWHEQFNLILLLQSFPVPFDEEVRENSIGKVLARLDKMKFSAVENPVFGYTSPWKLPKFHSD